MRPIRKITDEEENYRTVELIPGNPRFLTSRKNPVEPEPVGSIVLMAFRITGYDADCDGSLMARLEHIDKDGQATGWEPHSVGLYPDTDLIVDPNEWGGFFNNQAAHHGVDVWKVECQHCHRFTEVKRKDAAEVFGFADQEK